MPDEKMSTPATDAVKALAGFLYEPGVQNEPREKMQAELKGAGIDTAAMRKTILEKLAQSRNRQRLKQAGESRRSLLDKVARLRVVASSGGAKLREQIKELLDRQFGNNEEAAVLFHKFEEAKDEDLQTLLDDITLLEQSGDE